MTAYEPSLERLSNPILRYLLATRPPFLSVTLVACLIGLATAYHSGIAIVPSLALTTFVFALLAHAGVNVLNDYYDALNGTDAINTDRVFPFTGGSRFIQNGVLSAESMATFGAMLFGVVVIAGLWLTWMSGPGLLAVGALGLLIGWAYSAPPLKLNSRGIGEACVWAGFALIALGTDYVQRMAFSLEPIAAAASYALLVTNILYINQFPDHRADLTAGKRHLVVCLGLARARWGYVAIALLAYGWIVAAALTGVLPRLTLIALLSVPLSGKAANGLLRHAAQPALLLPAIQTTIMAALAHGVLLAVALALSGARA